MTAIRAAIPSLAGFGVLLRVWLGGIAGYIVSPTLWLAFPGLLGWLVSLAITAAQESAYLADAEGDGGESLGVLQFYVPTREALGMTDAHALSPAWSGYYAARYVQGALLTDIRWWAIALPILGTPFLRFLWTHGPSSTMAKRAWVESIPAYADQPLARAAVVIWTVTAVVLLGVVAAVRAAYRKPKKRARR